MLHELLCTLKPYPNNPRINAAAVDKVAASIREFGFQQPIVVDKNYVIIAGHTRFLAAKKLKLETVPIVIADKLTEAQIKAYRIVDNRIAETSKWDTDALRAELQAIEAEGGNIHAAGFGEKEIKKLMNPAPLVQIDYSAIFEIAVTCDNETDRHEVYQLLTARGYACSMNCLKN